jgi:DNA-binding LacI/PurR family transcriptional regulator
VGTTKLLYEKVYDAIKSKILCGAYQEGDLLPSEREIGEQHNVDRTTVRKALKLLVEERLVVKQAGIGTKVSRPDAEEEQRNRGNETHKRAANGSKGTIGFFLPPSVHRTDRISQPFYSSLFYHTERVCRTNGYACFYSSLDEDDDFLTLLQQQRFDGIIFMSNTADKFIQMAIDRHIPCVLVNEYNPKICSYLPDNISGMIKVCDHLIGLGHRKFALITGISSYLTSRERMIGCTYAFAKNNIEAPYVVSCDWEPDTAYTITKELLQSVDTLPTAIVGFNDNIAIGCLRAVSELGLRVPQDISIVGFDDVEQSRYAIPAITTVHIGVKELALASIQGLFYQMQNPSAITSLRSYVPCSLVIRQSSAKAPEHPIHIGN